MIFSSFIFILVYLPIVFAVYFILNKVRLVSAGKIWLVLASLFFYGYWSVAYLSLLLGSIVFNYAGGWLVSPYTKALETARAKKVGAVRCDCDKPFVACLFQIHKLFD